MKIIYSKEFIKAFSKSSESIQESFKERLKIFLENPYHPLINNHSLKGKLKGLRSINVTGDWRAIFEEFDDSETISFIILGKHSQLYR
jgi:addiction module RelE/StbE family toxin